MTLTITVSDSNVNDLASALRYDPGDGAVVAADQQTAMQNFITSMLIRVLNNYRGSVKPLVIYKPSTSL